MPEQRTAAGGISLNAYASCPEETAALVDFISRTAPRYDVPRSGS